MSSGNHKIQPAQEPQQQPKPVQYTEYDDMHPDKNYVVVAICSECKKEINRTLVMTGKDVKDSWVFVVASGALCVGACPHCKYSTFSDLNIHTDMKILEV